MITSLVPKKIAFAGDWHMNERWAATAIHYAAKQGADVILHAGDFGYTFRPSFLHEVGAALGSHGMHLFFVDGNHENHDYLRQLPKNEDGTGHVGKYVSHLPRGFRWNWDGVRFLGIGGAVSVDQYMRTQGVSWWVQEPISSRDLAAAIEGGLVDVVLAHDAPAGHEIPTIHRQAHLWPEELIRSSEGNRERLRQVADEVRPRHWFHGHYHVPYETTVFFGEESTRICGLDMDGGALENSLTFRTLDDLRLPGETHGGGGAPREHGLDGEALLGPGAGIDSAGKASG